MKKLLTKFCLALIFIVAALTGCTPQASQSKIDGVWRHEAPVASGFGSVSTERLEMKLLPDGKGTLKWTQGSDNSTEPVDGTWKRQGEMLVLNRADSSFVAFKIVGIDQAELRLLNRTGKLYRLARMPNE